MGCVCVCVCVCVCGGGHVVVVASCYSLMSFVCSILCAVCFYNIGCSDVICCELSLSATVVLSTSLVSGSSACVAS